MADLSKLVTAYTTIINELDDISRPGVQDTPSGPPKPWPF